MIRTGKFFELDVKLQEKLLDATYWRQGWMMRPYVRQDKETCVAYLLDDAEEVMGWTAFCPNHDCLVMAFVQEKHRGNGLGKTLIQNLVREFEIEWWRNEYGIEGSLNFFRRVRASLMEAPPLVEPKIEELTETL